MEAKSNFTKNRDFIVDISGSAPGNRPKAHIVFRYYEQYHDGTTVDIQVLTINKPILTVFQHAAYTNVMMNFRDRSDQDLRMVWNLIEQYRNPMSSVSYLPEELESGFYTVGDEKKMVYFPMLEIILSPIGREGEYEMHGLNPAFITLAPESVSNQDPCVLQFTFDTSWFHIIDKLEPLDIARLRNEVMNEMSSEFAGQE